ncbi:MAG: signal peptide peptidase SppA [Bacteroides sp.]|nr:signal peptide peptidase SppA [Bacteroides sp.]
MKEFIKYTLATITGIIISGIILLFFLTIFLAALLSSSGGEVSVKENSVMVLKLDGSLKERTEENPIREFLYNETPSIGLEDILTAIRRAAANDKIKGIYIQAENAGAAFASIQEIRSALLEFKETGKFIVSYSDAYPQSLYYLCTVADDVLLNPRGSVEWRGLSANTTFYKELLEKIGIEMQIFKIGSYKSAVEPFTSTHMSPENREQLTAYTTSIWNQVLEKTSLARHIPTDTLNYLANRIILFDKAEESLYTGLVDQLIYKDNVRDYLKEKLGIPASNKLNLVTAGDIASAKPAVPTGKSPDKIALYYAYGEIDGITTSPREEGINSDKVVRDLRKLREDKNIKAVVLRINSLGGSAFGSEQIWKAVEELKKSKPVVVSMGDYAASGGYYIACNADYIVAQPTTLTGSIGIYGLFPNAEKLLDKIGVQTESVKTNPEADIGNLTRPLTTFEKERFQQSVNDGYDLFLTRCAEGRGMSKEEMEQFAQGRVWTGSMAKELGLVDYLGGFRKAIAIADSRAGVENYSLQSYPDKKDFISSLLESSTTDYLHTPLKSGSLGRIYQALQTVESFRITDPLQARLPFEITLH